MRRRLILAGLVVASIALLSAYFREPVGGSLHRVQAGALEVTGPLQAATDRAVTPFRDLGTWSTGVWDARRDRARLEAQLADARATQAESAALRFRNDQLSRQLGVSRQSYAQGYASVAASVVARNNDLYYQQVTIDRGRADGLRRNDPVVNGDGLVGRIANVAAHAAVVQLLTDATFAVSARIVPSGDPAATTRARDASGLVTPSYGLDEQSFQMLFVNKTRPAAPGSAIVTSGWTSKSDPEQESLYPPDIPIGTVESQSIPNNEAAQRIQVTPAVDFGSIGDVSVLTGGRPRVAGDGTTTAQGARP